MDEARDSRSHPGNGERGAAGSERVTEAAGQLAQTLLENPLLSQALGAAFGVRSKAIEAQRSALHALDISSADDFERLERRMRMLGERLEALETEVDRLSLDVRSLRESSAIEGTES